MTSCFLPLSRFGHWASQPQPDSLLSLFCQPAPSLQPGTASWGSTAAKPQASDAARHPIPASMAILPCPWKLSRVGPGQYLDGRLPGNTEGGRILASHSLPISPFCYRASQLPPHILLSLFCLLALPLQPRIVLCVSIAVALRVVWTFSHLLLASMLIPF